MVDISEMMKQQMIKNLMNNNPQMQNVMKMIQDSGKSPQELFYQKAKEMNVDPNSILSMLR